MRHAPAQSLWPQAGLGMLLFLLAFFGWLAARVAAPLAAALPPCLLHRLTHIPCPTCGSTRALIALGRGEIATALALNPLLVLLGFGLILGAAVLVAATGAGRDLSRIWQSQDAGRWRRLGIAAIVLNWIYLLARTSIQ